MQVDKEKRRAIRWPPSIHRDVLRATTFTSTAPSLGHLTVDVCWSRLRTRYGGFYDPLPSGWRSANDRRAIEDAKLLLFTRTKLVYRHIKDVNDLPELTESADLASFEHYKRRAKKARMKGVGKRRSIAEIVASSAKNKYITTRKGFYARW